MTPNNVPDYEDSDEQKINIHELHGANDIGTTLVGWSDMYLKEEIKKGIREMGFETPSEVQKNAIPIILEGKDLLCQARSGVGKTAVFMIGVLNRLSIVNGQYIPFNCLIVCHTRELAHQVNRNFRRFLKYFKDPELRVDCFFGGEPILSAKSRLQDDNKLPHIVIGTPGKLHQLCKLSLLSLAKIDYFIIDQCDKVFQSYDMRKIIERMFESMSKKNTPQVMMFSATLSEDDKKYAQKFMKNQQHIFVDPGKLSLVGLSQFNVEVYQKDKLRTLEKLLDQVKFNQGIIFVNRISRAKLLADLLVRKLFNPICMYSRLSQYERIRNFDSFKNNKGRVLVATDLFGRGIDVQRVNLVINYDLPRDKESYLHRVGRAGRFNTKGIAINFVCPLGDEGQMESRHKDVKVMFDIQEGLHAKIPELPSPFDSAQYI